MHGGPVSSYGVSAARAANYCREMEGTPQSTTHAKGRHSLARHRPIAWSTCISREKLAELANIDRTYPSMLERGIRQPTLGRVIAIANALHIEPAAIVAATVKRLRPESATSSISQHGRSTPSAAQRQDSAPGGRCIPEQEPLIFNGPGAARREAL
jgi:transcriptional regulator with XRE-family HTH domain